MRSYLEIDVVWVHGRWDCQMLLVGISSGIRYYFLGGLSSEVKFVKVLVLGFSVVSWV